MNSISVSGRVLLPGGDIVEASIFIERGIIASVRLGRDESIDLSVPGLIVPGYIDLQINGAVGCDFSVPASGPGIAQVAQYLPRTGVTSFVPTIVSSAWSDYPTSMGAVRAARGQVSGAHILGVHLEGPFINPVKAGAHRREHIRPIEPVSLLEWADPTLVSLVTLAPELPGAVSAVAALQERGIVVSAGHSDARLAEAEAGFAAGIGWGTHLFNAMRGLHHREPGLAGALLTAGIPCGIILDGEHVHPEVAKFAYRCKGPHGLCLVTDAMAAAGSPAGEYYLGNQTVTVDQSTARLPDGTLAGSILAMDQAVRNAVSFTGCSLVDSVMMATQTPAAVLGLKRKGRIAPGCDGDLTVIDESGQVLFCFVSGELCFEATAGSDAAQS